MLGAIITFLAVCGIFGIYMWIVHRFLRAAEDPEDVAREVRLHQPTKRNEPPSENSRQPQWAH
jgi:hypothetical protein